LHLLENQVICANIYTLKVLIIQTAFIGDVVLATPLVEKLKRFYPGAQIDFLLRKGNEKLLVHHPFLRKVLIWDKKRSKYKGLLEVMHQIRAEQYDLVVNCQRFGASGLLTALSGARQTVGFDKNPFARLFSHRVAHRFGTTAQPIHEVSRNLALIEHWTDASFEKPRLYPTQADHEKIRALREKGPYACIAPTSVWFTKQYPPHKWLELIQTLPGDCQVFLLGGPHDTPACADLLAAADRSNVKNLAGQLSFLESAALMQGAVMNYVNDSAPMHIASAMNAPVTAVFCSTVPTFGFTPLSDHHCVVQTRHPLDCRPCGLHGFRACPKGHFKCAETIEVREFPVVDVSSL